MNRARKGMTLVEMVIAVAITALLLSIIWVYINPMMEQTAAASRQKQYAEISDNILNQLADQLRYASQVIVSEDSLDLAEYNTVFTQSAGTGSQIVLKTKADTIVMYNTAYFGRLTFQLTFTLNDSCGMQVQLKLYRKNKEVYSQSNYFDLVNMKQQNGSSSAASGPTVWYQP